MIWELKKKKIKKMTLGDGQGLEKSKSEAVTVKGPSLI